MRMGRIPSPEDALKMRVRQPDGTVIEVNASTPEEAARIAHQAWTHRTSFNNRRRSAIRGAGAPQYELESRADAYARDRANSETTPGLGYFDAPVRAFRGLIAPGLGRTQEQALLDQEVDHQDRFGLDTVQGVGGMAARAATADLVRDRSPVLSRYEELRLTPRQQRVLTAERMRASPELRLARMRAQGTTANPDAAMAQMEARAQDEIQRSAQRQAERHLPPVRREARQVVRWLDENLWSGAEESSRQAAYERYRTQYAQRAAELAGQSDLARAYDRQSEDAAVADTLNRGMGLLEATPLGATSLAVSPARAAARSGVRALTGRVPRLLRAPAEIAREVPGPLTVAGRRLRPLGVATVGGGAWAAAANANAQDARSYRVQMPDGTIAEVRATSPGEAAQMAANRNSSDDDWRSAAGGTIGGALASMAARRAFPTRRAAPFLGAVAGGAATGAALNDNAGVGAIEGGGIASLGLALHALRLKARAGRLTPEEARRLAELEARFGPLTAGERGGQTQQRLREDDWRRGMGGEAAASTMRGFDYQRAPVIRENAANIVTRGLPAVSADAGDAGRILSDELRTLRENQWERAQGLYDQAFEASRNEAVPPGLNQLPSEVLDAAETELLVQFPAAVRSSMARLDAAIQKGEATQASIERTRQDLQRIRRQAANNRLDADEFVASAAIDALDNWQAQVAPPSPAAARLMREARGVTREIKEMYGQTARVNVGEGHTGRIDLGGRAIDRSINADLTGEQTLDAILGAGFGSGRGAPGQQALGATRRLAQLGKRRIVYSNPEAASGARIPGRVSFGDRTADLDMRTRASQRFAAETPDARVGSEIGVQQPERDLQALREGAWHRIMRPLDDYLSRGVDHGAQQAGMLPAQRLLTNIDNALNHGGREIMEQIYTPKELAQMRDLTDYLRRLVPPPGTAASGTTPALMRQLSGGLRQLVRWIPIAGPIVDNVIALSGGALSEASAASQAKRAIRPLPRNRFGRAAATAALAGAAAAVATQGQAQTEDEAVRIAREEVARLEEQYRIFDEVNPNDPASVRAAQQQLRLRGLQLRDDGVLGNETATAIRRYRDETKQQLDQTRIRLAEAETAQRYARNAPEGWRVLAREAGPLAALGAVWLGYRSRRKPLRLAERAVAQRESQLNNLIGRGTIPRATDDVSRETLHNRVSGVNEFWRQGGAGGRTPFVADDSEIGFARRPMETPPSRLYQDRPQRFRANDLAIIGSNAAEAGTFGLLYANADAELKRAQAAVEQNPHPTDEQLARVQRLSDERAAFLSAARFFAAHGVGRTLASVKNPYPAVRPNVRAAEQERLMLGRVLAMAQRGSSPIARRIVQPETMEFLSDARMAERFAQHLGGSPAEAAIEAARRALGQDFTTKTEALWHLNNRIATDPSFAAQLDALYPPRPAAQAGGRGFRSSDWGRQP